MYTVPIAALLLAGCISNNDPLSDLDERYTSLMVTLGAAERDTARNVKNMEARRRRTKAERARVAFFRDKRVQRTIEENRTAEALPAVKAKADAYWRHMLLQRSWKGEEKADESRLLGRLEESATVEASWNSTRPTMA